MSVLTRSVKILGSLAVLAVISAACATTSAIVLPGDGQELRLDDVGTTCSSLAETDIPSEYFAGIVQVERVETSSIAQAVRNGRHVEEFGGPSADELRNGGGDVVVRREDISHLPSVLVNPADVEEFTRLPAGRSALLATRKVKYPEPSALVQFVAIESADGELVFAGECARSLFQQPLSAYRDAVMPEVPLGTVFIDVVTEDAVLRDFSDFLMGTGPHAAPSFESVEPANRVLDREETPPSVIAKLVEYPIRLYVPDSWSSMRNGAICSFAVGQGWNECFTFEALDGTSVAEMFAFGVPSGMLEFWLIDYVNGGVDEPLAYLGGAESLPEPGEFADALEFQLSGGENAADLADLAAAIRAGDVSLIAKA